ncbi:MAG: hypothetical protein WD004_04890 [Actinomycetota bacterium]
MSGRQAALRVLLLTLLSVGIANATPSRAEAKCNRYLCLTAQATRVGESTKASLAKKFDPDYRTGMRIRVEVRSKTTLGTLRLSCRTDPGIFLDGDFEWVDGNDDESYDFLQQKRNARFRLVAPPLKSDVKKATRMFQPDFADRNIYDPLDVYETWGDVWDDRANTTPSLKVVTWTDDLRCRVRARATSAGGATSSQETFVQIPVEGSESEEE